jgi:hypothetical protein
MSLNTLPAELQQVVYDFDGRYKAAMARCLLIITQRRSTFHERSWIERDEMFKLVESNIDIYPQYYAEVLLRASRYQSQIKDGKFQGIESSLQGINFRDVIGVYTIGKVEHITIINGKGYKSISQAFGVSISQTSCLHYSMTRRFTTRVKCIDVLDPVFQKSVKDVKEWRELGVSENGIPAKDYIRQAFGKDVSFKRLNVDGRDYILVDNRLVCRGGNVYGTLNNDEVTWLTNER